MVYRYPHAAFPYAELVARNAARGRLEPEFELADTGSQGGQRAIEGTRPRHRSLMYLVDTNVLLVLKRRTDLESAADALSGPKPCPTSTQAADELARRLARLFLPGANGVAPGLVRAAGHGRRVEGYLLFHEFFHGDTGEGLGASHQTGWTALVAHLLPKAPPA